MKFAKKWFFHFYNDSLYRNSFFLMLGTAIMSAIGFVYWFVAAKLYTPEQIGLTTTFISVISLISGFSLLGVNTSIIRFLPTSENKTSKINTALTLVCISAVIIASSVLLLLPQISPTLMFLRGSIWLIVGFILFAVFASLNTLTDSVFIAYRSTHINLIVNTVMSLTKLVFLPLFVGFGTFGLTGSYIIAITVAFFLSIAFTALKFKHSLRPHINTEYVKSFYKYSVGNYLAGFIGGLPTLLMPLIITQRLGPDYTAYYYMPMMIIGLLYIIPQAVTQSLLAEGSSTGELLNRLILKSVLYSFIIVPACCLVFTLSEKVLYLFGPGYFKFGYKFLLIMLITSLFYSINSIFIAIYRIRGRIGRYVVVNLLSFFIFTVCIIFIPIMSLESIGFSFVVTQAFSLFLFLLYSK